MNRLPDPVSRFGDVFPRGHRRDSGDYQREEHIAWEVYQHACEVLRLDSRFEDDGTIHLDVSEEKDELVRLTIEQTQEEVEQSLEWCMQMEAAVHQYQSGEDIKFDTFEDYVQWALDAADVRPIEIDERLLSALRCDLINFWRKVSSQLQSADDPSVAWENYLTNPGERKTTWQSASFIEMGQKGWWRYQVTMGITRDSLSDNELFPSPWITHTTSLDSVGGLLESGTISSGAINLAASKIVAQGRDIGQSITFIFDIREVMECISLKHGDYAITEGEIKASFPVPLGLARAVIPTRIFYAHHTGSYSSDGWIAHDIDTDKIVS